MARSLSAKPEANATACKRANMSLIPKGSPFAASSMETPVSANKAGMRTVCKGCCFRVAVKSEMFERCSIGTTITASAQQNALVDACA